MVLHSICYLAHLEIASNTQLELKKIQNIKDNMATKFRFVSKPFNKIKSILIL
jgi:hypothetical protein